MPSRTTFRRIGSFNADQKFRCGHGGNRGRRMIDKKLFQVETLAFKSDPNRGIRYHAQGSRGG
jgi:hypothetical protein